MSFLKNTGAAALSAMALAFMVSAAGAQNQHIGTCRSVDESKDILKDVGELPTGKTGSTIATIDRQLVTLDLELYANTKTGAWTVVGTPSGKSGFKGAACMLGGDTNGYPDKVEKEAWYKAHFGNKGPAPAGLVPQI
ncbi:MAG TPA: hypothetical protein VIG74_00970 [Alphaproteobacteria bacterium]|jgi:hypothetical protein